MVVAGAEEATGVMVAAAGAAVTEMIGAAAGDGIIINVGK
jgi:hypothetical protein